MTTTAKKVSVSEFLTKQIDKLDKPQVTIAQELGYDKPNIITMFKQGKTKLPFNKIVPMAKSIEVDPVHMLRVTLQDYSPETWQIFEQIIGDSLVTEHERKLLKMLRETAGDSDALPETAEEVKEFKELVKKWKKRTNAPTIRHY